MGRQTGRSCRLELASNSGRIGSDKGFAHRMRNLLSIQNRSQCQQKGKNYCRNLDLSKRERSALVKMLL